MEIIKDEKKKEEKMDENENKENVKKENIKKGEDLKMKEMETSKEIILIKDSLKEKENLKDKEKDKVNEADKEKNKPKIENMVPPKKDKEPIKLERQVSAPPTIPEVTACSSCREVFSMSGVVLLTRVADYIQTKQLFVLLFSS